jgi:hypothetical protein
MSGRHEIEAIYLRGSSMNKQLFIRLIHNRQVLRQFHPFLRPFLRINLLNGAPIAIAQSFLAKPIEEILENLQALYTQELNMYNIQIEFA